MVGELMRIREKLTLILSYDWVSVPLVYTQLVTLAVYSYFLAALFGAQWVQPDNNQSYTLLYSISVGTTVSWTVQICFVMVRRYTHSRDLQHCREQGWTFSIQYFSLSSLLSLSAG